MQIVLLPILNNPVRKNQNLKKYILTLFGLVYIDKLWQDIEAFIETNSNKPIINCLEDNNYKLMDNNVH